MLNYIKNLSCDLNRNIHKFIFVSTLLLFSGMGNAADDGSKAGDSIRGAKEWANNCSRCHNMRDPKEFRDDKWRLIVSHMRVRAGLHGQQTRDILAFLQSSNFIAVVNDSNLMKVANADGADGADGETTYKQTCIACHGANGEGAIPGVPKLSERLSKSDSTLLSNIKNGFQSEGSVMAMPAKGGNPGLTNADIKEVLIYLQETFK
jgi:mono/diheme cytochrome c family protein